MSNDFKQLLYLPLGGSGEIGMNLNLYSYDNQWIMVDCGISFADDYLPGIDLIMPNVDFVDGIKDDLKALVLTHAHEDHIGAVVHLWPRFGCPIYATPFTAILLRSKFSEAGLLNDVTIHEIPLGGQFSVGDFELEYVTLTHSIPEPNALNIKTPLGTIFHTGDWKIDPDPLVGENLNSKRLQEIGDEGVLAIVCDSTNVFNKKPSGSELEVRDTLIELVKKKKEGAVFCTTFSSNVARLSTLGEVAKQTDRHLCLIGRSMKRNVAAAKECGYLQDLPPIMDEEDASHIPRNKIMFVMTGCQGEARAALMRIVLDNHKLIHIAKGDTVIFSSKVIPGNERTIFRVYNLIADKGAEIISEKDAMVHVSGHPGQEELKQMYDWIRPEIVVPTHGENVHLNKQAAFAKSVGYQKTAVPRNGLAIKLAPNGPEVINEVPVGRLALDGVHLIEDDDIAIVERRRIMHNGVMVIHLVMDNDGYLLAPIDITSMGVPDDERGDHDKYVDDNLHEALSMASKRHLKDDDVLNELMRTVGRRASRRFTGKGTGPITTVKITRIK